MNIDGITASVLVGIVLAAIGLMLNFAQIPATLRLFGIAGDPTIRGDARVFAWARVAQSILRTTAKALILLVVVGIAVRVAGYPQPVAVYLPWTLDLVILMLDIDSVIEVWSRRYIKVKMGDHGSI